MGMDAYIWMTRGKGKPVSLQYFRNWRELNTEIIRLKEVEVGPDCRVEVELTKNDVDYILSKVEDMYPVQKNRYFWRWLAWHTDFYAGDGYKYFYGAGW